MLGRHVEAAARRGRFKYQVWGLFILSHWIKKHLL